MDFKFGWCACEVCSPLFGMMYVVVDTIIVIYTRRADGDIIN